LRTKVFEGFRCSYKKRPIKALDENAFVLNDVCKFENGLCRLDDSIVIWKVEQKRICPFYPIGKAEFFVDGYKFISNDEKLAFEAIASSMQCETNVIETSSGIFLASTYPNNLIADELKKESLLLEETNLLTLADSDYFKYQSQREREITQLNLCLLFKTLVKTKQGKDEFMVLENVKENMVLRFLNNNVYRVVCEEIQQISIGTTSRCLNKIQVSYVIDETSFIGYLDQYGLITNVANSANCSGLVEYFYIPNSNITLIRNETKVLIAPYKSSWSEVNWLDKSSGNKIFHSKMLLDEIRKHEDNEKDLLEANSVVFMPHVQTMEKDDQPSLIWSFVVSILRHTLAKPIITIICVILIYLTYKLILRECRKNAVIKNGSLNETIEMNVIIEPDKSKDNSNKLVEDILSNMPSRRVKAETQNTI
jgi:hypothetical protein